MIEYSQAHIRALWAEEDKRKHFYYSFVILLLLNAVVPFTVAVIATWIIGLIKEIWDHYYGSGFCWKDMQANGLGIAVGMMVGGVFPLLGAIY